MTKPEASKQRGPVYAPNFAAAQLETPVDWAPANVIKSMTCKFGSVEYRLQRLDINGVVFYREDAGSNSDLKRKAAWRFKSEGPSAVLAFDKATITFDSRVAAGNEKSWRASLSVRDAASEQGECTGEIGSPIAQTGAIVSSSALFHP